MPRSLPVSRNHIRGAFRRLSDESFFPHLIQIAEEFGMPTIPNGDDRIPPQREAVDNGRNAARFLPATRRAARMPGSRRTENHTGFTLVELLVVIGIIGILIALLLPAVQAAREAARRTECSNNLTQIGLAMANYEVTHGVYAPSRIIFSPPGGGRRAVNGLLTLILPFIEQTNLANVYDYGVGFDHAINQTAVNAPISVYQCPSTPSGRKMETYNRFERGAENIPGHTAQATDYMHPRVIMNCEGSAFGVGVLEDGGRFGPARATRPRDILDGLSNTCFMLESAGHPVNYILHQPNGNPPDYFNWYGEWPDTVGLFVVPYTQDGIIPSFVHPAAGGGETARGTCLMNCNNNQAPYSFHPNGINVNLCDGSVRYLSESIDAETFWSLCCRDDGNVLGEF